MFSGKPDSIVTLILSFIGMAHYYVGYCLGGWTMAKHFLLGTFKLLNSLWLFPWFWYDAYSVYFNKSLFCPFGSINLLDPTQASDEMARSFVIPVVESVVAPAVESVSAPVASVVESVSAPAASAVESVVESVAGPVGQSGGGVNISDDILYYISITVIGGLFAYLGWQLYKSYMKPKIDGILSSLTEQLAEIKKKGEDLTESFDQDPLKYIPSITNDSSKKSKRV